MVSMPKVKWDEEEVVLLTGGHGLIGSYLIRELLDLDKKIVVMSSASDISYLADTIERITFVSGSCTDMPHMMNVMNEYRPDVVYHLDYSGNRPTDAAVSAAIQLNIVGFNNVMEASKLMKVRRVVFGSSQSVYGLAKSFPPGPVNEDVCPRPVLVYGAWRLFNEQIARFYRERHGLDSIGLRYSVVYGLGKGRLDDYSIAHKLIENAIMGRCVEMPPVDYEICWEYIKDAIQACLRAGALQETPEHMIFNVGGFVASCSETVEVLKRFFPDMQVVQEDEYVLPHPVEVAHADMTRAKEELGYEPVFTLEEGIKDYIQMMAEMKVQYRSAWIGYGVIPLP